MAGGGAAPAKSSDDPAPHPTKDQLPNVSYCITSPPPWRKSTNTSACFFSLYSFALMFYCFRFDESVRFFEEANINFLKYYFYCVCDGGGLW